MSRHEWIAGAWAGPIRHAFCTRCGADRIERTDEGRSRADYGEDFYPGIRTTVYVSSVRAGGFEVAGEPSCRA